MARLPRLVLPDGLHHVLQRGHNHAPIVVDDQDRRAYLDALRESALLHGVRVHGYALMDNHVHLLVTPSTAEGLARAMQTLGRRYVAAFNRRHARNGTLWEGRFRTALAEPGPFFHMLLRYVEQHPLRTGLCDTAAAYAWSSAAHHLGLRRDPLVSEHASFWALGNTPFERERAHREALATPLTEREMAPLRAAVHSGWPLLSVEARQRMELALPGRFLAPRKPGRRPATLSPK